jgi:FkbM family methyltransferase
MQEQVSFLRRIRILAEQLGPVGAARVIAFLIAKKIIDPSAFISYSQFGEDRVIAGLLSSESGFYLDIGANHPIRYSNTFMLYCRGWRGILVEPNAALCDSLRKIRINDIVVNAAVNSQDGEVEMYFSKRSDLISGVGPQTTGPWQRSVEDCEVRSVPAFTVSNLLDRYAPNRTVDFMNIDVEGHEMACLAGVDFGRHQIDLIAIEMHGFRVGAPSSSEVWSFLESVGFHLIAYCPPTGIFRRVS